MSSMWADFIARYTAEVVRVLHGADRSQLSEVELEVLTRGTVAYEPASKETIVQREEELGFDFPPSLRSFLQTSNGLAVLGFDAQDNQILSVEQIDRLENVAPKTASVLRQTHPSVGDDAYESGLAYSFVSRDDVGGFVAVTPYADSGIYLLNPRMRGSAQEFEAVAQFFRGQSRRFESFEAMLVSERNRWLQNLRASLAR